MPRANPNQTRTLPPTLTLPHKGGGYFWNDLLATLLLVVGVSPFLHARPPVTFQPEAFRKMSFSSSCLKKEWSILPDNTLELLLPVRSDSPCQVTLEFTTVQNLQGFSGIQFEARSGTGGQRLALELAENHDEAFVLSPSIPLSGLTTDWRSYRLDFNQFTSDWQPKTASMLRFVALPDLKQQGSSRPTLFIRKIAFLHPPLKKGDGGGFARQRNPPAPPFYKGGIKAQILTTSRINGKTFRDLSPFLKPIPGVMRPSPRGGVVKWLWVVGVIGSAIVALRGKRPQGNSLSPLYEINTRTWKSHRDKEGVITLGGFKKINLHDLKSIKHSGFNAIWLMGIWEVGPKVRDVSKRYGPDFMGSPFAISDYHISTDLGTEQEFRDLVRRAHSLGLAVFVDFVPNHMGLDSLWLNSHPEFFIHKRLDPSEADLPDVELEKRYPGHFPYRTPSYPQGEVRVPARIMVAYGKDPYFYPWIDTAQLDYANPGLRRKMMDVLTYWAKIVDGVRCDMAMLILREQVKIHRHPEMSWEAFNRLMPHEFWSEAIQAVKRVNNQFTFIAETYWAMEGYLQRLGFDYTYNKPLYEAICSAVHSGQAEGLMNFLRMLGTDFLKKGVHFLENHDEERAMNTLGEERQRAAATIVSTLPGIALFHQGQLEGKRERLPVQRVVPLHEERENSALHQFYRRLMQVTGLPIFREGRLIVLYSNNSALVSYARVYNDAKAIITINASNRVQKGSVFLSPWLRLRPGISHRLHDLYYDLKGVDVREQPSVQPLYTYAASQLINQGLYVELKPFDAHIFLMERPEAYQWARRAADSFYDLTNLWPLNRLPRRVFEPTLSRSSNENLPETS